MTLDDDDIIEDLSSNIENNDKRSGYIKDLNENETRVFQMFLEYSESDTPYISRTYISDILGIPVNKVITILNNLVNKELIVYDVETNKYTLKN